MINLARQALSNPLLSAMGATSFQPGVVGAVGRCPYCGNAVAAGTTIQPQTTGLNPQAVGAGFGQQMGGFVPNPYAVPQATGVGQINPFASQFGQLSHHGAGGQAGGFGVGGYSIDPRFASSAGSQQFGYTDPTQAWINPAIAGNPINTLFSQQQNPLGQQQLPIRPLIGGQQGLGSQSFVPGIASPIAQWADPYRAFIEAQLISQLAGNPLYQLQRAYGGVPDVTGFGVSGTGQQFNPLFANLPFYG
jgi:hypothetical protein